MYFNYCVLCSHHSTLKKIFHLSVIFGLRKRNLWIFYYTIFWEYHRFYLIFSDFLNKKYNFDKKLIKKFLFSFITKIKEFLDFINLNNIDMRSKKNSDSDYKAEDEGKSLIRLKVQLQMEIIRRKWLKRTLPWV